MGLVSIVQGVEEDVLSEQIGERILQEVDKVNQKLDQHMRDTSKRTYEMLDRVSTVEARLAILWKWALGAVAAAGAGGAGLGVILSGG